MEFSHYSVMLPQCMEGLNIKPDGIYIDGTAGGAGHSRAIAERLTTGQCTIELGFVLTDISTNFERVSDHCSNIAVCLIQTQADGYEMHEYLDKLKEDEDPFFEQMFEEYRKEYRLPS